MMSEWVQLITLAIVQGLTEFLPVSSSAHLILIPHLTGWEDQGISMDISVHVGTLLAVLLYFHRDLKRMVLELWQSLRGQPLGEYGHQALQLMLATLPVCLVGAIAHDWIADYSRHLSVIATTTIVFGLLLGISLRFANRSHNQVTYPQALAMGFAQALALIPGTSRSGITLTAALFMGLGLKQASRFAFLMAIPVIIAAMSFETMSLIKNPQPQPWLQLLVGAVVSALFALSCIHFFLKAIEKIGLIPFVIYRLALGAILIGVLLI